MVWYSHLFKDFPQFVVMHRVKAFGIVNKAEIDVFLELSWFFDDPAVVGNLISGSFWEAQKKQKVNVNVPDLGSKWMLTIIYPVPLTFLNPA